MDEARARLTEAMNRRRQQLGIKWNEVARRADMSVQNLLRIRNGEIGLTEDAAHQIERALQWPVGRADSILRDSEGTPPDEPATPPTDRRRSDSPTAFDQLRDAVDRLRTEAQADPAADREYVEVLEDFEVLSYALRRLGPRNYQRAVISLASRYQRELGTDTDTAYQAG